MIFGYLIAGGLIAVMVVYGIFALLHPEDIHTKDLP